MREWRLIDAFPAGARTDGAWHMAVDQTLMSSVARGDAAPTLRLYAWDPACLSIGVGQRAGDVDMARLRAAGGDLVRRPTGGRAIWHANELTYSVTLPADDPLAAGELVESYQRISTALVAALQHLGAQPNAERAEKRPSDVPPICFEVASHYEITVGGRKLIGSAQLRRGGGVLQHGSLPLEGDIAAIADVLRFEDEDAREAARRAVRGRAITLYDALGGAAVRWDGAARAVSDAFRETFDLRWTRGDLTDAERTDAERLAAEVYESEAWTLKRK